MAKDEIKFETNIDNNKTMKLKDIISSLKIISIIIMIFSTIVLISTVVLGTLTTLSVVNSSNEQLLNNDSAVDFIAKMNSYSFSEVNKEIADISNKGIFVTFQIIIPTLFVIAAFISLLICCKKILDFIKNVKSNKGLFIDEKLLELKKIRILVLSTGILFLLAFDFSYFFIFLVLELTLEIIIYLFNYCVKAENLKEKNNK